MPFKGVLGALGLDPSASWRDRVRPGAYTSPTGTRIEFQCEAVSREVDKRTTAFGFLGINGEYIQDRGYGARRYPLACYFSGPNCDRIATAFENALLERGRGELEHPLYGTFEVIPFGTITRRDDLKTAANQSVVETAFWTALSSIYPASSLDAISEISSSLDGFDVVAAQQFDAMVNAASAANATSLKGSIRRFLAETNDAFDSINAATSGGPLFDAIALIHEGLDTLVGQPLFLAQRLLGLTALPARALNSLLDRIAVYRAMAERLFGLDSGSRSASTQGQRTRAANSVAAAGLMLSGVVAGLVRSATTARFRTRPEALEAAEEILAMHEAVTAWRDAEYEALGQVGETIDAGILDTGSAYQQLSEAVSLTTAYLVEISFTLLPERRIVLDRPRTIVDLAAELYGSVDDRLDFLISTNNLSGSEILELPRGKAIVYYA